MSNLTVQKETGELLFDTNLICYGLIKSGYMAYLQSWTRKTMPNTSLDPNSGANWTQSTATAGTAFADSVHGFTVYNALSPVVFIVGSGCLVGTAISGNATTFYYTNADTNTKYYCFDLMADNMAGSTYLKTWTEGGRITFNSLQPPLNVIAAIQAPGPGATDAAGRYRTVYAGGFNRQRQAEQNQQVAKCESVIDIYLGEAEYAAYLPWSRGCGINDLFGGNAFPYNRYSGSEGAYGRYGGISFIMGATAGTTQARPSVAGQTVPCSFDNLPTDRYPVALVIYTNNLLFPYN